MAFDADARLLGLRDEIWHNKGAYIRPTGIVVSEISIGMIPWPYNVPAYDGVIHVVTTNKTPVGPYRAPGASRTPSPASSCSTSPPPSSGSSPSSSAAPTSEGRRAPPPARPDWAGSLRAQFGPVRHAARPGLRVQRFETWRREAEEAREEGRLVGAGIGYFMDKSGLGVYETAGVDVDPDGSVRLLIGGASSGQGIETVMAQIAGDVLGIPVDRIQVFHGDTDLIPDGVGSWSSRSTVIGGSAVLKAAEATKERALTIGAELLEATAGDLVLEEGIVHVRGSATPGVSLGEIAAACDTVSSERRGDAPGLGAREIYEDPMMNYPYGVGLCQLEIDSATGEIDVRRYFVAYEAGRAVNPMLLKGQIVGGAIQGLGGALYEELLYDEAGQPKSTSFMDYLLPGASETPTEFDHLICEDAPTPTNPLKAKGAGESGIMAVGAAVAGAVSDALGDPAAITRLPLTPERVRSLIEPPSQPTTRRRSPHECHGCPDELRHDPEPGAHALGRRPVRRRPRGRAGGRRGHRRAVVRPLDGARRRVRKAWRRGGRGRRHRLGRRVAVDARASVPTTPSSCGSTTRSAARPASAARSSCIDRAAPTSPRPASASRSPSRAATIPGYLRLPARRREGPSPCCVLIGGLESTKEESYLFEDMCLRRGMATFAFDGPARARSSSRCKLGPDFERYASAVLDHLVGAPSIDAERHRRARSQPRRALRRGRRHATRVCAAVRRVGRLLRPLGRPRHMPAHTRRGFVYVTGIEDAEEAREHLRASIDLAPTSPSGPALPDAAAARRPRRHLHAGAGGAVCATHHQRADLEIAGRADGDHCCHNMGPIVRPRMADWMAGSCGARRVKPPTFDYAAPDDRWTRPWRCSAANRGQGPRRRPEPDPAAQHAPGPPPTSWWTCAASPTWTRSPAQGDELAIGAMVRQRKAERDPVLAEACPAGARRRCASRPPPDPLPRDGRRQRRPRRPGGGAARRGRRPGRPREARGPGGERSIAARRPLLGHLATTAGRGEILTAVELPVAPPGTGAACVEIARRAGDYAALRRRSAQVTLDEARSRRAPGALFGIGRPTPGRASPDVEADAARAARAAPTRAAATAADQDASSPSTTPRVRRATDRTGRAWSRAGRSSRHWSATA